MFPHCVDNFFPAMGNDSQSQFMFFSFFPFSSIQEPGPFAIFEGSESPLAHDGSGSMVTGSAKVYVPAFAAHLGYGNHASVHVEEFDFWESFSISSEYGSQGGEHFGSPYGQALEELGVWKATKQGGHHPLMGGYVAVEEGELIRQDLRIGGFCSHHSGVGG
jgi:hypothetical protein